MPEEALCKPAICATQGGRREGPSKLMRGWEGVLHPLSEVGEHLCVAITTGVEHYCGAAALQGSRR